MPSEKPSRRRSPSDKPSTTSARPSDKPPVPKLAAAESIGPDPDKTVVVRDSGPDLNRNDKNSELADALNTTLNDLDVVQIDRLEIGVKGWRITYR